MRKQKLQLGSTVKSSVVSTLSMVDELMYGGTLAMRNMTTVLEEGLYDSMTDKLEARTAYEIKLAESLTELKKKDKSATAEQLTGRV